MEYYLTTIEMPPQSHLIFDFSLLYAENKFRGDAEYLRRHEAAGAWPRCRNRHSRRAAQGFGHRRYTDAYGITICLDSVKVSLRLSGTFTSRRSFMASDELLRLPPADCTVADKGA